MSTLLRRTVFVLALLVASVGSAQDEKAIEQKVDKALAGEMERLRLDLVEFVRRELGGAAATESGAVAKALGLLDEGVLRKHASFLASDELEGRNSGYPGNDKAAEYIAGVMKAAGLKPVGDKDDAGEPTYFQSFTFGKRQTRNCLGLLEGTDPDLKKEIVVIGAHHDHVGRDGQFNLGQLGSGRGADKIWNGADDNASGTSCVLALIRAFGEGGLRTKRSILFMTFSAEEAGLVGSEYYCRHPIAPIQQHVFMLNLDMVGRNGEKPVGIHGVGSDQKGIVRKAVEAAKARTGLSAEIFDRVEFMGGDSDHSSFRNAGVPFTFFFTGLHPDYHRVTDHADKLDYANMLKICRTALHVLCAVGDAPESPRFQGFNLWSGGGGRMRRTIGITPDYQVSDDDLKGLGLPEGSGAIRVKAVTEGSVAEKAGLQEDDFIVSINGRGFSRDKALQDLRSILNGVEAGKEVPIEIVRDKQKQTLKAVWDK